MEELTDKQKQVLKYIEHYQLDHGKSPTIREIREYLKVSSDNSVLKHLVALEKKGYISKDDTPRGIKLLEHVRQKLQTDTVSIPLLGFIPAGGPIHAEEHVEDWFMFDTSRVKNPAQTFMLTVTGNSMIDAGIFEGDLILADGKREPRINDIVVALVDGENTVKRLVKKDGNYFLKAENPDYTDIFPITKMEVQGVVVSLIRNFI